MSGETRDLFAGTYAEPPETAEPKRKREADWIAKESRSTEHAWQRGFVEGLGRAAELAMLDGDHGTVCRLIEEGSRRFGELFLDEVRKRGIRMEDLV